MIVRERSWRRLINCFVAIFSDTLHFEALYISTFIAAILSGVDVSDDACPIASFLFLASPPSSYCCCRKDIEIGSCKSVLRKAKVFCQFPLETVFVYQDRETVLCYLSDLLRSSP